MTKKQMLTSLIRNIETLIFSINVPDSKKKNVESPNAWIDHGSSWYSIFRGKEISNSDAYCEICDNLNNSFSLVASYRIEKKPKIRRFGKGEGWEYICPVCEHSFGPIEWDVTPFCPSCGQALQIYEYVCGLDGE